MLKRYFDREEKQKEGVLVVITQSEEPNPDDSEFDIAQINLNNEDIIKNWDKLLSYLPEENWTDLKELPISYG